MELSRASARRRGRAVGWALAVLGAVWAVYALHAVGALGGSDSFFSTWVYTLLMWSAAALVVLRALAVRRERLAWALLAGGLVCWAFGDLLWTVHYDAAGSVDVPSWPDLFYYLYYPLTYAGLALLVRARLKLPGTAMWLDGLVVGLTLAALCAAVAFEPISRATTGGPLEVATSLGYVVADLMTLCLGVVALALSGRRPGRAWWLLVLYLVLGAAADGLYTYVAATGGSVSGGVLDVLWPAAALVLVASAWHGWRPPRARHEGFGLLTVAGVSALLALAVLVYAHRNGVSWAAVALAAGALLATMIRCAMSLAQNFELVRSSRRESLTDGLTGLGNRRRLMDELTQALRTASPRRPQTLVFCDLDGFKAYNDGFGHAAGDALLARLGVELRRAVQGRGRAFRLGGDEFCVLLDTAAAPDSEAVAIVAEALTAHGEGFHVGASIGVVGLPEEATTANAALLKADERMYAQKESRRPSARHQARELLIRVLGERQPELRTHLREVASLAGATARRLGLSADELDEVTRGAELRDLGKIAVPDAILHKSEPLDEAERQIIREHTIVGERILAGAPALRPVAKIVRSSHERWDGRGYPDQLAGDAIPIGARIVAVCDAYHALVCDRTHAPGRSAAEALAELRRCAGTQFDPRVVDAFLAVQGDRPGPDEPAPISPGAREPVRSA